MAAGSLQIHNMRALIEADSSGGIRHLGCTTGGDLYTFAHRTLTVAVDNTLDDIDKTVTVPAGRIWWVHSITVTLITSATVGDRLIRFDTLTSDASAGIRGAAGAVLAASTRGFYSFFPGAPLDTAFIDRTISAPIPTRMLLIAADIIRVREINAVDAGSDDMLTRIVYDEITV